jgi:BED zinc finger
MPEFSLLNLLDNHFRTEGEVSKSGEWVCNKCGKANKRSGGWTNLLNHVSRCVGDKYEEEYERLQPERSRITSFVLRVSEREKDMHNWIEWVIMRYLPLSIVDCPMTRCAGVCWKPTCSKQLQKQIEKLAL